MLVEILPGIRQILDGDGGEHGIYSGSFAKRDCFIL
jgi:hypothetical protein